MVNDDLTAFLHARLNEDEQAARAAEADIASWGGTWEAFTDTLWKRTVIEADAICDHIARHDPARVLAEVNAKRRIIDEHPILTAWKVCTRCSDFYDTAPISRIYGPCPTLRLLALPHAGHPDYRQEWRP